MKIIITESQFKEIVRSNRNINEQQQSKTSNILHTTMDLISMGFDFFIPGSGGTIDVLNGISYILEASFKQSQKEKESLYILATISFASVVLIGPLQGLVIPLKSFITNRSTKIITPQIINGLNIIKKNINIITEKVPSLVQNALRSSSPYAVVINKKWGNNINKGVSAFTRNIGSLFDNLNFDDEQITDNNTPTKREFKPTTKLKNDIFI
jgi:hypothetical protein